MRVLLVPTDFSPRSDRALRRAVLLARQIRAELALLHVVDEDRAVSLVEAERREAEALLTEMAATVESEDRVGCRWQVRGGDAFAGILEAADELDPLALVLGPPRRHLLRGVFTGTTAERVIRQSRRPVLVANGVPAAAYRRILLATDLSPGARAAAAVLGRLGFDRTVGIAAVHVLSTAAMPLLLRTPVTASQAEVYRSELRRETSADLARFLVAAGLVRARPLVYPVRGTTADTLVEVARKLRGELLVLATRGRVGLGKLVLGSVAEAILARAEFDVLAVPPDPDSGAAREEAPT